MATLQFTHVLKPVSDNAPQLLHTLIDEGLLNTGVIVARPNNVGWISCFSFSVIITRFTTSIPRDENNVNPQHKAGKVHGSSL